MTLLTNISFKISKEDVYRLLKTTPLPTRSGEKINLLIDEMLKEGYSLSEPRGIFQGFTIKEIKNEKVILGGIDFKIRSKKVARVLNSCRKISLLVCTIGEALPRKINELMEKKEITKAMILDAVGSEAIEGVANSINGIISQGAEAEGFETLTRFSPGYGDWDLTQQEELLKTLQAEKIGVSLNKSYLMLPEKSISAVVGWVKIVKPVRKILRKAREEK